MPESESNNEMHGQSVQQDAISKCGHLERHHNIGTCENAGKGRRSWNYFDKCNRRVFNQTQLLFVGVLNECASVVALEEGIYVHYQILQSGL